MAPRKECPDKSRPKAAEKRITKRKKRDTTVTMRNVVSAPVCWYCFKPITKWHTSGLPLWCTNGECLMPQCQSSLVKNSNQELRNTKVLSRSQRSKSSSAITGRPSDGWISWDGVRSNAHATKIRDVLETGDWAYLRREALNYHQRHTNSQGHPIDSSLKCEIEHTRFASGASNVVLEVAFSDSTYWIVRIRLSDEAEEDQEAEMAMQSEVATMRLIQRRTSVPIATVFGFSSDRDNPFGHRYMFMNFLPGRHLNQPFAMSVPQEHWAKVAAQLADILHQISTKMAFEKIGSGVARMETRRPALYHSAHVGRAMASLRQSENAAINTAVHARLREVLGQDADEDWFTACRIFEHALCGLVLEEKKAGPFPMKHPDFHFNNILLDDNFNITGILDWTGAQTVPCESFAAGVEFITPPTLSKEAPIRQFRVLVKSAWRNKESDRQYSKFAWSMSDAIGSLRGDLIHFSYTFGALRRAVAYARIVVLLLYGSGFTLDTFKRDNRSIVEEGRDNGMVLSKAVRRVSVSKGRKREPKVHSALGEPRISKRQIQKKGVRRQKSKGPDTR